MGDNLTNSSPHMWRLQGSVGDMGPESLNFQGIGVNPWVQARIDTTLLGLQPDMYHAMAASALQEMRTMGNSQKLPPYLPQVQLSPSCEGSDLLLRQMVQHSQTEHAFLQSVHGDLSHNMGRAGSQFHYLQQQLQEQQIRQKVQRVSSQQQMPDMVTALDRFASDSQLQSPVQKVASLCQKENLPESDANLLISHNVCSIGPAYEEESTSFLDFPESNSLIPSDGWLPRQVLCESLHPSGGNQCAMLQVEKLDHQDTSISPQDLPLSLIPKRECLEDREGDSYSNSILLVKLV